jgi:anti-sigma-K factor RskA
MRSVAESSHMWLVIIRSASVAAVVASAFTLQPCQHNHQRYMLPVTLDAGQAQFCLLANTTLSNTVLKASEATNETIPSHLVLAVRCRLACYAAAARHT